MDGIEVVPPMPIATMTAQDRKINHIINEITKPDKDKKDVPLHSLKRKMRYKHSARKFNHRQ
ncbi:hypothetical protein PVK06_011532 [Gossypium arboreum]|uniref:Uncharacterized protein n=1 Tax=Gossypium arboreum TaxID=29729 RepID=A0ABR0QA12_GOSAR|nr:hypothetical protein PVK06_011532 [Gossypium arboreum]